MTVGFQDRNGQVWEWFSPPVERCYILRSWVGEHPANGLPITCHTMLSLTSGTVFDEYLELTPFEDLSVGVDPEMRRLL